MEEEEAERKRLAEEEEQRRKAEAERQAASDEENELDLNSEETQKHAVAREQKLLEQLPRMIAVMEQKLAVADKLAREGGAEPAAAAAAPTANSGTDANVGESSTKMSRCDDAVRLWCLAELSRWRLQVLTEKSQTDADNVDAMTAAIETVRTFEVAMREITPLLDGLKAHTLPAEMAAGMFRCYTACHVEKKYLAAEQHYFDFLLGNNNWHIGLAAGLHQRAAHMAFLQGNVKSVVHNAEVRKALVVFKSLMTRCEKRQ